MNIEKSKAVAMAKTEKQKSLRIKISGLVQGVGFRPFVYRLAKELGLKGWVSNSSQGVIIEIAGEGIIIDNFLRRLDTDKPAISKILSREIIETENINFPDFAIKESDSSGDKIAVMLPDIAICPDCLKEIFNPANRRYLYPFTNCTNCGPRFSIIEDLPYDRANTTMKGFEMCDECRAEYENPFDRRFHAQPNACPECGPHLELLDKDGRLLFEYHNALKEASKQIKAGNIIALKGLAGFQLIADARNEKAVANLRQRKAREEKPLAIMYPDLAYIMNDCDVSAIEKEIVASYESPITIVRKKASSGIAPNVASGNPNLGVMLPYTPLHHLLMAELGFPVVATSGNISDEPICIDNDEALKSLGKIADYFLMHNRPIARHVDDSVVRVMAGKMAVLRRARGFAPLPVHINTDNRPALAVGGHLKSSVAISLNGQVFISQHIGDLETAKAYDAFKSTINSLTEVYEHRPQIVLCDRHPDYLSTKYADSFAGKVVRVQHHLAHILSCMAENSLIPPVIGVSWDGIGYGDDGTIWGGEFIKVNRNSYERIAHLKYFPLPGGEKAIKEPRRAALGLLHVIYGDKLFDMTDIDSVKSFDSNEIKILKQQLSKRINAPMASSAGRLFDAVASLLNVRQTMSFEGQAAMELEFLSDKYNTDESYKFYIIKKQKPFVIDWALMIIAILHDIRTGIPASKIARMFHNTLVAIIADVAKASGEQQIVLSGGCFQNKYLLENSVRALNEIGLKPYWHSQVPPNDGGICLGQIAYLAYNLDKENR